MRIALVAAAFAATTVLCPAHAQEGTPAQRKACKPDVFRLCNPGIADVLDHSRVIACMQANKNKLSAACTAALKSH